MLPDLGKYAFEVTAAYGVSLVLLAGIVAISWRQHSVARRQLKEIEARKDG